MRPSIIDDPCGENQIFRFFTPGGSLAGQVPECLAWYFVKFCTFTTNTTTLCVCSVWRLSITDDPREENQKLGRSPLRGQGGQGSFWVPLLCIQIYDGADVHHHRDGAGGFQIISKTKTSSRRV